MYKIYRAMQFLFTLPPSPEDGPSHAATIGGRGADMLTK
jgi:hypothetical protein